MRQHEDELERLGVRVAMVTFQAGRFVEAYVRETALDWPILVDDTLRLYGAYRMGRGNWWNLAGPPALWAYAKLVLHGRRPRMLGGDVTQLGGDVLIDPDGMVRLHHVGRGPADRPSTNSILDIVRNSDSAGKANPATI